MSEQSLQQLFLIIRQADHLTPEHSVLNILTWIDANRDLKFKILILDVKLES